MDNQATKLFDFEERAKVLNLKYSARLKLIDNTFVRSYPKNVIVAGGYFTSVFHGEEVKDVDIFVLKNNGDEDYGKMINAFARYVSGNTTIVKKIPDISLQTIQTLSMFGTIRQQKNNTSSRNTSLARN